MGKVLGKSAKAARAEQFTYITPPPFNLYGVTKYLDMLDSRGERISQIPDLTINPPTDPTDPQFWNQYTLYMFKLNSSYIKVSGDYLLVPTATSSDTATTAPWVNADWDMDPSTGFEDADIKTLLFTYANRYVFLQGQVGTVMGLCWANALFSAAGITAFNNPSIPYVKDFPNDMPKPSAYSDFASLEAKTYLVEFKVPASPIQEFIKTGTSGLLPTDPNYIPPLAYILMGAGMPFETIRACDPYLINADGGSIPPAEQYYKIGGWFIKGDGIKKDSGEVVHPLVILGEGSGGSIFFTHPVYPTGGARRYAPYLVAQGFDVLIYDSEGRECSSGWNQCHDWSDPNTYTPFDPYHPAGDGTGNAPNIFHMINELAGESITDPFTGATLSMTAYDATGMTQHTGKLIESAQTTPVVLFGESHGALISARAMQLHVDDKDSNGAKYGGKFTNYNLRGVAELAGSDCLKFYGDYIGLPLGAHIGLEACLRLFLQTTFYSDSEIFKSINRWPGYLIIKGIYDGLNLDGAVEAYNRARGFKEIAFFRGIHGLIPNPNFYFVTEKLGRFCKQVSLGTPDMNNTATTTLWPEINKSPVVNLQEMWNNAYITEATTGRLHGAEISYQNALNKLIKIAPKHIP